MATDTPRPARHLVQVARDYPAAWAGYDRILAAAREGKLPRWPEWCHAPLAAAYAVVSEVTGGRVPVERAGDVARVGALAAWRTTQGIYRLDPDLLDALWRTPVTGDLPVEVLHRLPEWCVYVEVGRELAGLQLHGVFAHLEVDANDGREELRLLLDCEGGLAPVALHLTGTLDQALEAFTREARRQAASIDPAAALRLHPLDLARDLRVVEPLVSLVLYLCSDGPDLRDAAGSPRLPARPRPTKTKRGLRLFPAQRVSAWEVGYRIGPVLRRAAEAARGGEGGGGEAEGNAGPRPHIRRAHWHTYHVGPRGQQRPIIRWLNPILVGAGEIVPTVRRVE